MNNLYERIVEAQTYIQNRSEQFLPKFGIILGTGLGRLAADIKVVCEIPYGDIPHFPVSTVQSHAGKLILGYLEGVPVVAMAGRFHYYEGYSLQEVTFPIRVLKFLGIERLFISSAVGSINAAIEAGDIVLVRDHINFLTENPLRGANDERLGVRFPDMSKAYDHALNTRALELAKEMGIRASSAVYIIFQGPSLETPAEYQFAHTVGADVVGMSTVPEVIVARHMELPILVTSVVSNKCYPIESIQETTLQDVLDVVALAEPKLTQLIKKLVVELAG